MRATLATASVTAWIGTTAAGGSKVAMVMKVTAPDGPTDVFQIEMRKATATITNSAAVRGRWSVITQQASISWMDWMAKQVELLTTPHPR